MGTKTITGIVEWLKHWFYDKTEITGFLNLKANQSDLQTLQGTVTTLGTTVNGKVDKVTGKGLSTEDYTSAEKTKLAGLSNYTHPSSHPTTFISNDQKYNNIKSGESSTLTLTNQKLINDAINTKLGELSNVNMEFIKVVSDKGTASASTMNTLYIVEENSKVNVYYTVQNGSNYTWNKLDDNILDELNVTWDTVTGKPDAFPPSSHTHGNITNAGTIGTTANLPLITTTSGKITTGSFEATKTNIKMNGTQAVGSLNTFARADHVHPSDTSKISTSAIKNDLTTGGASNVLSAEQGKTLQSNINNLKGNIVDWDTLEFVEKSEDESGAITFDFL